MRLLGKLGYRREIGEVTPPHHLDVFGGANYRARWSAPTWLRGRYGWAFETFRRQTQLGFVILFLIFTGTQIIVEGKAARELQDEPDPFSRLRPNVAQCELK